MRARIGGHLWTIAPELVDRVRPLRAPPSTAFSLVLDDAQLGPIRLGGRVRHEPGADTLVLVVHGLGGSSESPYARRAAAAAAALGWSCARIDLRGADGSGEDVYHAGLFEDLAAVLREASFASYAKIVVLGHSLGGHVTMRLAHARVDPRIVAVAAVCAPVDLSRSATAFDRRRTWVYRTHVLRSLKAMYRRVAARRGWSTERVDRVAMIRDWDREVVVPRHGFADVEDYYARASIASRLDEIVVPTLWMGSRFDPMVPASTVEPAMSRASSSVEVRWLDRGGHVGFPADVFAEGSVEAAALSWLGRAW